jgi:hypothetical protein
MKVIRTWKSDDSQNEMSLETACLNLQHNSLPGLSLRAIANRLLAGRQLETMKARFAIACTYPFAQ